MTTIATCIFLVTGSTAKAYRPYQPVSVTKLNMCVLTRSQLLKPEAEDLQELNICFRLEGERTYPGTDSELFDEDAFNSIKSFIEKQEQPVCLIAHDGHRFHFRALKTELEQLGRALPSDIRCADSLRGFFEIILRRENPDYAENMEPKSYVDLVHDPYYHPYKYSGSFALDELYNREIGSNYEDSSQIRRSKLIQLAMKYGQQFMAWVDRNHCYFSEVPHWNH